MATRLENMSENPTGVTGEQGHNQPVEPKVITASEPNSKGFLGRLGIRRNRPLEVLVEPRTAIPPEPAQARQFTEEEVRANALLTEEQRVQATGKALGIKVTSTQEEALLKAHSEGSGELGKDETNPAGIYNYKFEHILHKARDMKEGGLNKEQRRVLIESGIVGALASPDWLSDLAEQESPFQEAWKTVNKCLKITPAMYSALTSARKTEFDNLLTAGREVMDKILVPATEGEREELQRILYFVRDDIRRIYTEAVQGPTKADPDSWSSVPTPPKTLDERIASVDKALGGYQELFWDYGEVTLKRIFGDGADIQALMQKYKGVASYVAARTASSIGKELKGQELYPNSKDSSKAEFGDFYLQDIEREIQETRGDREKGRREQRKRATAEERLHYNSWREKFDFTWAETPEELDDSIEDWLDLFQRQLTKEAEEAVYQKVQKWSQDGLSSFEQAVNRIGLEANDVRAVALREKIIGHEKTIAGARLLESKGGFEYYLKLKKDFASNYDPYFDGIYLKEGSAIMADKLSENDGEIYRGGDEDTIKPSDGGTRAYRGDLEREAVRYGTTHELYITRDDFVNALLGEREIVKEVSKLNLSFDQAQRLIRQKVEERRKVQEIVGKTDFETAELDKREIEQAVAKLSLSRSDSQRMIARRLVERREARARAGRYSWDDGIEELLLGDSRGLTKAQAISPDPNNPERKQAEEKVKTRTNVFKEIKKMSDKEEGLDGLTLDERKVRIRERIRVKIAKEGHVVLLQKIARLLRSDGSPDLVAQDRVLWKWVEEYNKPKLAVQNEDSNNEPWFPSLWDEERLYINRPEDLVNRVLSKQQFRAMVEKIEDPYEGLTNKQIEERIINDFRKQAQREVEAIELSVEDKEVWSERIRERFKAELGRDPVPEEIALGLKKDRFDGLMERRNKDIRTKIENVLFERQQRETRAVRNFRINVAQDKFEEFEARWGGLTTRVVDQETGKIKLRTVYSLAKEILKAKIDKEAQIVEDLVKEWKLGYVATHPGLTPEEYQAQETAQRTDLTDANKDLKPADIDQLVEEWKIGYVAAYPGLTDEQIKEATIEQRRLSRRHCTFATTLGLRELGIAKDLPGIGSYYYYSDVSRIKAFAPYVGYTEDDKGELPELLDRGRREMDATFHFLGQLHMDGRILEVVDRKPGLVVLDKKGRRKPAHEERWVRPRVINAGGSLKLRDLFETMFMVSTSGGVEVVDMISRMGKLGVNDAGWENGSEDKREWQGFRKRRCRWEYREQSFFNTREWADPLTHVDRLAGAANARKFLVGGEIEGQGHVPGVLVEPMSGAYKYRDMFFSTETWALSSEKFHALKLETRGTALFKAKVQEMLDDTAEINNIDPVQLDKLVEIGAGIMKPLIDFMNSKRYTMNRAGLAPKNWKYDNEIIVNAYFDELLKDDTLGGENLDYAPQGRSPIAVDIFRNILKTSSYHILVQKDREILYPRAEETKLKMTRQRSNSVIAILPQTVNQTVTTEVNTMRTALAEGELLQKGIKAQKLAQETSKQANIEKQKLEERKRVRVEAKKKELEKKERKQSESEIKALITQLDVGIAQEVKDLKAKLDKKAEQEVNRFVNQLSMETEDEISRLVNKRLNEQLHEQLQTNNPVALDLPPNIVNMLNARRAYLKSQHVSGKTTKKSDVKSVDIGTDNIEAELKRLIDQYIDTKLHMEFVGEWLARLVSDN